MIKFIDRFIKGLIMLGLFNATDEFMNEIHRTGEANPDSSVMLLVTVFFIVGFITLYGWVIEWLNNFKI